MAGPTKPFDAAKVGEEVQKYRAILDKLYDANGHQQFRQSLFDCSNEGALRAALATVGVIVAPNVRIMLVDIENARTLSFDPKIDPTKDDFYVYIMPRFPRRSSAAEYKAMQAWEGAWHHAIVDGYGM